MKNVDSYFIGFRMLKIFVPAVNRTQVTQLSGRLASPGEGRRGLWNRVGTPGNNNVPAIKRPSYIPRGGPSRVPWRRNMKNIAAVDAALGRARRKAGAQGQS